MKAHDGMFLDGSWRPALGSGTIEVTNPADGTVLGAVPAGKVRMPDMTGWPARRALQQAFELGLKPRLEGTGLLVGQTPAPGAVVGPGENLVLVFEPAS